MWWFLVGLCVLNIFPYKNCYNIDVDYPIIIEDPNPAGENYSYFGYSLILYGDKEKKWIKIGAPRATYITPRKEVIHRSGVVYHCPFLTSACKIEENFNYSVNELADSFIGGAMDISDDHKTVGVSAFRWQDSKLNLANQPGSIFIENLPSGNVQDPYFLKDPPLIQKIYPYYLRASAGMSLNFIQDKNELLIGAPGVYNFLGTVLRIRDVDKNRTDWKVDAIHPRGNFYEYSGYAVASGKFYNKRNMYYVSGLPRGYSQQVPFGVVIVFTFQPRRYSQLELEHTFDYKVKNQLFGLQFGEYFGSALAVGDLNGDGLDDLVVGAPFRSNSKHGYNHGSVYIFYGNSEKLQYNPKNRFDNTESGSRFGTAIMVLSDMDKEGLPELAISAPGQETSGVVYIYTFDNAQKTMKVSQKIAGKDIYPNLRGFGTSFSKAMDIDDNNFPDFAVGSPLSGHAVVLRSRPLVLVHPNIHVSGSLSQYSNNLSFHCCYYFTEFDNRNLTIIRNVTIDKEFGRFYFNSYRNFEEKSINITQNQEYCESLNLAKTSFQNHNDPITITLTYRLPDYQPTTNRNPVVIKPDGSRTEDAFCKKCPILSKKSKLTITKLVVWDHNCNHNGRKEPCKSKLEVNAKFLNLREENTFTLGSKDLIELEITVVNRGDPAFSPLLQIDLPNGVLLLRTAPIDCENYDNLVACNVGNVLNEKVTYTMKFSINVNEIVDLLFSFNVSTITDNISDRSTSSLTLKLKREADFLITGYSKEPSYIYDSGKPTLIENIFKVEKFGPSPTPPAEIIIIIPHSVKSADETYEQFVRIIDGSSNETALENSLITCEKIAQNFNDSSKTIQKPSINEIKVFYLNCSMENIKCVYLKCFIGSLDDQQNHAQITVNMEVDFRKLNALIGEEWLMQTDQIIVTTGASILANGFIQTGNRSDHTEVSNVLLVNKEFTVSLWIVIGSVIAGLIILICMILALKKVGFFVRKKHILLRQFKEENHLIEELIQKELEKEENFDVEFRTNDTLLGKETNEYATVKKRES